MGKEHIEENIGERKVNGDGKELTRSWKEIVEENIGREKGERKWKKTNQELRQLHQDPNIIEIIEAQHMTGRGVQELCNLREFLRTWWRAVLMDEEGKEDLELDGGSRSRRIISCWKQKEMEKTSNQAMIFLSF